MVLPHLVADNLDLIMSVKVRRWFFSRGSPKQRRQKIFVPVSELLSQQAPPQVQPIPSPDKMDLD